MIIFLAHDFAHSKPPSEFAKEIPPAACFRIDAIPKNFKSCRSNTKSKTCYPWTRFPRIAIRMLCIPRATCPPSLLFKSIHWTLGKALVHGGCKFATTAPTCRGFAIHRSLLGIKQDKGGNASAQMDNNLRCSVNIPCLELEGVFGVGYRAACTFVERLLRREIFRRWRWWYYYRSIAWLPFEFNSLVELFIKRSLLIN